MPNRIDEDESTSIQLAKDEDESNCRRRIELPKTNRRPISQKKNRRRIIDVKDELNWPKINAELPNRIDVELTKEKIDVELTSIREFSFIS